MKTLLLVLLGTFATQAKEERSWVYEVRAWSDPYFHGTYKDFNEATPHLDSHQFDNTIASVKVKGVWIFYDMPDYNTYDPAFSYYVWGLDHEETFPNVIQNKVSSLRPVGSLESMNQDGYNLYEGTYFTKKELYHTIDIEDLAKYHEDTTSIIIIGKGSWTFCEDTYYHGRCVCLHATQYDENYHDRLDVGFYPDIHTNHGLLHVRSVRKGCYA